MMAGYRRAKSPLILTGVPEVDHVLKTLKTSVANRVARPALTKGVRLAAKKIRAEIPSRYKDARKAIGHTVKMEKGGPDKGLTTAKVGAAVGKKQPEMPRKRAGRKGVGISATNIHWFLLGTKERHTKAGHYTGRMLKTGEAPFENAVRNAMASGMSEVVEVIKRSALESLDREVPKHVRRMIK